MIGSDGLVGSIVLLILIPGAGGFSFNSEGDENYSQWVK